MWGKRKRKHCRRKVKFVCLHQKHGCEHDFKHEDKCCDEGFAKVSQTFCTGTVTGTTNVFTPVFTNVGDATVFNRSCQNGYNNTA